MGIRLHRRAAARITAELSGPPEDTPPRQESMQWAPDGESNAVPQLRKQIQLNEEGKFCPGHVDLTITACITGFQNRKPLPGWRGHMKTEAWNGWSDYGKAYVNRLNSQTGAFI
ncbi:MAG: hypothetical protein ACLUOI_27285 [Eisenbergiella sp.]